VIVGLESAADVRRAFDRLVKNAKGYKKNASIQGVQIQQMLKGGQGVMVGAVTDPSFGKMIAFGLGGVLVEVMKDITFRMTPVSKKDAMSMLDSIGAAEVLRGVRGRKGVDRAALAAAQGEGDVLGGHELLLDAYRTDVRPICARVRAGLGAAEDPVTTLRSSGWLERAIAQRGEDVAVAGGWGR